MTESGKFGPVAVLGAGSWGTTLAGVLAGKGHDVLLWAREREVRDSINERNCNEVFLPEIKLPENLRAAGTLAEVLDGRELIVSVVPSKYLRGVLEEVRPLISPDSVIISATKGIERGTLLTASGIIADVLDGGYAGLSVLSGPSFAREVAVGLPAAVCAASSDPAASAMTQGLFSTDYFRVYTNPDVLGVELGGALKNVIAISSGISDGLELGYNSRAALITRGLAEMARLGSRLGAEPLTFAGLSGMGDLVLTCTGSLSRNYTVGVEIGRGVSLEQVTGGMRMVAEGVETTTAARELARVNKVQMPITEAVYSVLNEGKPPRDAVFELMARDLKEE